MSKVKNLPEDIIVNKEKMRHTLRRIETKRKIRQRKAKAENYLGYILIDTKAEYKRYYKTVPEERTPIYEEKERKYYDYAMLDSNRVVTVPYIQQVQVGEKITPEHTYRYRRYLGERKLEKPYVVRIGYSSKKSLKRIANKKARKILDLPNGNGYKRASLDIAWEID